MNPFELLTENLREKAQPLSSRAKSIFFALSAYRIFPVYKYFHEVYREGDSESLKRTLNDIFDHAVNDLPLSRAIYEQWLSITEDLYPDEDIGDMLGPIAGDVALVVKSAGGILFLGEWSFWRSGSIEPCLAPFRYTVGMARLGVTFPGDRDAPEFYGVVMNDERFVKETQNLHDDINSLLAGKDSSFKDLAIELRERAFVNKIDAAVFCLPLME